MAKVLIGVHGLATPDIPVRLSSTALLKKGERLELEGYHDVDGLNPVPYTACFEGTLIVIDNYEKPLSSLVTSLEAVFQLSVDAVIGFDAVRDGDFVLRVGRGVSVGNYHDAGDGSYRGAAPPTEGQFEKYRELWSSLSRRTDEKTETRIRRGLRRYQRALEEIDDEAVFHLVAASEALVAPEHKESGRRKRFLKRMSGVISEKENQRSRIEDNLKRYWVRRSGFAHGDKGEASADLNVLRSYVHKVLLDAVEYPYKYTDSKMRNLA